MRDWKDLDLGVVETIFEDEHEDSSLSPSLPPTSFSSPSPPLQSRVDEWSEATGHEPDVLIHVEDLSFHLHKDPLISRSDYLKRKLTELTAITISPPLNITPDTFSAVADFCYGSQVVITPFNVAALRIASELLDMTDSNGDVEGNLRRKTETYFCQAISVNQEYAAIVLRSCLALLPDAEKTAFLVSRCIEALGLMRGTDGVINCLDGVKSLEAEKFQVIAASMHERFTRSHDILYRIVDLYLEENNGKLTEEQKIRICSSVDCNKLSTNLLVRAIQNPRMPLRFIVRAMLVEQLNTRRTIISAATTAEEEEGVTLGAILHRDAALRQAIQLKSSMEATSSRIESLERDLSAMKKLLHESEKKGGDAPESGRSASFHFCSDRKIERRERGSNSSASFRFSYDEERAEGSSPPYSDRSYKENPRSEKPLGWRLMKGLKSVFRTSSSTRRPDFQSRVSSRVDDDDDDDDEATRDVGAIGDYRPSHRRSRSVM